MLILPGMWIISKSRFYICIITSSLMCSGSLAIGLLNSGGRAEACDMWRAGIQMGPQDEFLV